jgi:16S rRNA (adenine1518-N6/adenine1519-N6)-dimethyltransferase
MSYLPKPRKRFGQNFLQDRSIIHHIVTSIAPHENDHIVEIGPGRGALTQELLARVPHIQAIEIDRDLCAYLKTKFKPEQITLIEQDVLTIDFKQLALNQTTPPHQLRLVGNLPYNLSSELLIHWTQTPEYIQDIHIMLQKEVIERLAAAPSSSDYSKLTVAIQRLYEVEPLFDVPPTAFFPIPAVDSMVARLIPHSLQKQSELRCNPLILESILKTAFGQRRKMLSNSLRGLPVAVDWDQWGILPSQRPEEVSVQAWVNLARLLEPLWPQKSPL